MLLVILLSLAMGEVIEKVLMNFGLKLESECPGFNRLEKEIKAKLASEKVLYYQDVLDAISTFGYDLKIAGNKCLDEKSSYIFDDFADSLQNEASCVAYHVMVKYVDHIDFKSSMRNDTKNDELDCFFGIYAEFRLKKYRLCSIRSLNTASILYSSLMQYKHSEKAKLLALEFINAYSIELDKDINEDSYWNINFNILKLIARYAKKIITEKILHIKIKDLDSNSEILPVMIPIALKYFIKYYGFTNDIAFKFATDYIKIDFDKNDKNSNIFTLVVDKLGELGEYIASYLPSFDNEIKAASDFLQGIYSFFKIRI